MDDEYFQTTLREQNLGPKYKNEEINTLVKSINDLAGIFNDISVLVVEQGTILDRIDHNIYEAKEHVVEANKHLTIVEEKEKSKKAQACIKCQLTAIGVLTVVIFIKMLA